ncbi:MAG: hydrogenase maturation nickel metallochaperone HypA [Actinomycetota bacterium]|nr:hydrogenase maturation nickel metallochaperone HypA [Actinomycetota bacterium]
MHELSVASAVLNTALRHASDRPVKLVRLRVGRMRQVIPGSLTFYFEIVSRDTACEGAVLELEEIETRLCCQDCGQSWSPQIPAFRCPACESATVAVVAGEELEVDYIEVEEQEVACIAPR